MRDSRTENRLIEEARKTAPNFLKRVRTLEEEQSTQRELIGELMRANAKMSLQLRDLEAELKNLKNERSTEKTASRRRS